MYQHRGSLGGLAAGAGASCAEPSEIRRRLASGVVRELGAIGVFGLRGPDGAYGEIAISDLATDEGALELGGSKQLGECSSAEPS